MARRKSKKISALSAGVTRALSGQEQSHSREEPRPQIAPGQAAKRGNVQARRAVPLPTCIAACFLTLVLGLYLGTLLPGVFETMRHQGGVSPAVSGAASAVSQAASPQGMGASSQNSALAELEAATRREPGNAAKWAELGNLYFDLGRPKEAINAYETSLRLKPGNPDVLTDMGIMYREVGSYQKAVDCFRQALAISPRHENSMFNEGVVLFYDLGRKPEGIQAWERLLKVNPGARTPDGRALADLLKQVR